MRVFRSMLRDLVAHDHLPDYAVEMNGDTVTFRNREALDAEFGQLKEYIDRVAKMATYNGKSLLKGFGSEVDAVNSTAVTSSADVTTRRIRSRWCIWSA